MRVPSWFLAGLFLVALMAAFEAAPRLVLIGPGGPRPGSLLDNGSLGMSELAAMLRDEGATLGVGVRPPDDWRGPVVYLLAGPMSCSPGGAEALARVVAEQAAAGRRVGVVAASSGNYTCARLVVEALAGSAPVPLEQAPGLYLVLPGGPLKGPLVLYAPDRVEPVAAWRVEAAAVAATGEKLPGVLTAETPLGVRLVYIPDWPVFSNALIRAEREAGLDPARGVTGLFAYAAGSNGLRGVLVLQPTVLLPEPETPAGIVIQPGVALARAAEAYAKAEATLYQHIIYNPFMVLVVAMAVAGVYYLASIGPGDRSAATREAPPEEKPPYPSPTTQEALAALREATLVALGATPAQAAMDEELLRRLASAAGLDTRLARKALIAAEHGKPPRLRGGQVREAALALATVLAQWATTRKDERHGAERREGPTDEAYA